MSKKVHALALLSGGLDSTLAIRLLQNQGITVTALSFATPFFGTTKAAAAAQRLGIELITREISEPHFEIVKNPPHGYGKQMNPCIDCHGFMFRIAREIMESQGFDFISTGEVLGQRPMSQNKRALLIVEQLAGLPGQILRPLSAQRLPVTKAEEQGLVDRGQLLDIMGKSRVRQMALAADFGITDYPTPAGGCKLTDPGFAQRLRGLLAHQPQPYLEDVRLITLGKAEFVGQRSVLIIGRDTKENSQLDAAAKPGDVLLDLKDVMGPTGLLRVRTPDTLTGLLPQLVTIFRGRSRAAREYVGELTFDIRAV